MTKLIVFDLDETLLTSNSHYEFAFHFFKIQHGFWYFVYRLITSGFVGKIVGYIGKDDSRRLVSIQLFRFFKKSVLTSNATALAKLLFRDINQPVFELFCKFRAMPNCEVCIITATPDFLKTAIEEKFGVAVYCSYYKEGRIIRDLRGQKADIVNQFPNHKKYLIVSDDANDLLDIFERKILVNKDKILLETSWEEIN